MLENLPHWMTVEQIAQYLQISKETIYRWLDKKVITAHRVGKQWRFSAPEIDKWIRQGGAIETSRPEESRNEHVGEI